MQSALVWFRRDLRCFDHAALYHALRRYPRVHCAFVFDSDILEALPSREDRRVDFIWHCVVELDAALARLATEAGRPAGGVIVRHGPADQEIPRLAAELGVEAVFANRDYEPAAISRDDRVAARLALDGRRFEDFKDQVIFEKDEVLTRTGQPFSVFTPYKNAWLRTLTPFHVKAYPVGRYAAHLAPRDVAARVPDLAALGFKDTGLASLRMPTGMSGGAKLLDDFAARMDRYKAARDFPAKKGVSYLSAHLRFGTVSIRALAGLASQRGGPGAETWLSELIWRDFYHMILWHHPRVVGGNFRPEFDGVRWERDAERFATWCEARTGYPIVDAAMRQLNQTGYMHNRLRMIVASFLTKDLGIDWREGEGYFAEKLLDFDLAANNGGWQWAASTGCDAQPWFRIFNPVTQSERFDPEGDFIRRYLPELSRVPTRFIHAPWLMGGVDQSAAGVRIGKDYPAPVVDHAVARALTLERFGVVRKT